MRSKLGKQVFRGFLLLSVIVIGIFAISGCVGQEEEAPETVTTTQLTTVTQSPEFQAFTLVDDHGYVLQFTTYPTQIVSLAPSNTEILFAVGAGDHVVGVTDYCNYPHDFVAWIEASNMTTIGGFWNPPIEPIVALDPDLIVAAPRNGEAVPKLRDLGFNVLLLDPENINGILQNILLVGKVTGHEAEVSNLVSIMRDRIDTVVNKVAGAVKPKVYHEIWNDPLMSAGPETWIDELIQLAGGINIFENATAKWPVVSSESIMGQNPDVMIFPHQHGQDRFWSDSNAIKARPGWDTINAVQNDQIYEINADIITRAGPRIVDALETIAKILHPKRFSSAQLAPTTFSVLFVCLNQVAVSVRFAEYGISPQLGSDR